MIKKPWKLSAGLFLTRGCTHYCYISEADSLNSLYRWVGYLTVLQMIGLQVKTQRIQEGRSLLGREGISGKSRWECCEHRLCQNRSARAPSLSPGGKATLSPKPRSPPPPTPSFCRQGSSTDHTCGGFGNQKLKISYGFSSSQNDPSKLTDWELEHTKPQSGWRDVCFSNDLLILCNPQ